MSSLADKALAVDIALTEAGTPHAFGGALALAFHIAEPRGTRDIDINVFVPANDARTVLGILPTEVQWTDHDVEEVERNGQVRVFWDDTPLDLFFVTHPFHENAASHVESVPFAGREIPILAADDLAVFKAFFDRTKDWADIEAMIDGRSRSTCTSCWVGSSTCSAPTTIASPGYASLIDREPPQDDPRFAP